MLNKIKNLRLLLSCLNYDIFLKALDGSINLVIYQEWQIEA